MCDTCQQLNAAEAAAWDRYKNDLDLTAEEAWDLWYIAWLAMLEHKESHASP